MSENTGRVQVESGGEELELPIPERTEDLSDKATLSRLMTLLKQIPRCHTPQKSRRCDCGRGHDRAIFQDWTAFRVVDRSRLCVYEQVDE